MTHRVENAGADPILAGAGADGDSIVSGSGALNDALHDGDGATHGSILSAPMDLLGVRAGPPSAYGVTREQTSALPPAPLPADAPSLRPMPATVDVAIRTRLRVRVIRGGGVRGSDGTPSPSSTTRDMSEPSEATTPQSRASDGA